MMKNEIQVLENGDLQELLQQLNTREKNNSYRIANKKFMQYLQSSGYGLIDGIQAYKKELDKNCKTVRTYNTYLQGIKKHIKEIIGMYETQISVDKLYGLTKELDKLKQKKLSESSIAVDKENVLSYSEIREFIASINDNTIKLIVELLASTGLRISEALNIKLQDILKVNKSKNIVTIRILGKGNKERIIYTQAELITRIKEHFQGKVYLIEHSGKKYNSISITNRIKYEGYKILGKKVTAHTFRHSYATEQLKHHSTKKVSIMLGHSSTSVTEEIYNHNLPTAEDYQIEL